MTIFKNTLLVPSQLAQTHWLVEYSAQVPTPSVIHPLLISTVVSVTWLGSVAAAQSAVPGAVPEMNEEEVPLVHCVGAWLLS